VFLELQGRNYEELRDAFRWRVPATFNMAVACSDRQDPQAPALIVITPEGERRRYTFGDISELSRRLANALRGLGVGRGERVGIILPQGAEVGLAHLATYRLGAIAVPLSGQFGPDALQHRLGDSRAKAVITDRAGVDKLLSLDLEDLRVVLSTDGAERTDRRVEDFWEAVRYASPSFDGTDTAAEDPALLIYTSGTTGPPKGALHAQRVLLGHLPGFELSHEFLPQPGDLFWTPADWAWIGGLMDALLPSWFHGIPVVGAPRRGFDPEWAFRLLGEERIRNAFLPPTALKMMRETGLRPKGLALRTVMSGGEVLGEEVLQWGRETLGVTVNEIFGQTEANYVVGNCSVCWPVRPGSMGRPYPGHDVEVLNEDGPTRAGEAGEVAVRTPDPVTFLEYWGRPQATEEKFRGEWLMTGDIATRDEDGYLWYQARSDDVIISASYRIGPSEIEECLLKHPAVAMAAVIGVPDEARGQAVKAFIVLKNNTESTEQLENEIRGFVRERVAAYQYPRLIEFVTELPLTTTGKIRRGELRARERSRAQSAEVVDATKPLARERKSGEET
jgi:acetyl-CoA synthetase